MSSFVGSFEINGVNMSLPGTVSKEVAEAIGMMVLDVARNGVGEKNPAKGMLIIAGETSRLKELGSLPKRNKFKAEEISVLSMDSEDKRLPVRGRSFWIRQPMRRRGRDRSAWAHAHKVFLRAHCILPTSRVLPVG